MTNRSILDVDIGDTKNFNRFVTLWKQFQQQLKDTPAAWRQVDKAQGQATKALTNYVKLEDDAANSAKTIVSAHDNATRVLRQQATIWQDIRRQTSGAAINIKDMTGQLLKWTTVTGAISGLLGAGGLFGVTRLAEGVASGRRNSLSLGTTYGGGQAFATAYRRFVSDPGSFLAGVEGARTNVSQRAALYGAGLTDADLSGSTEDVSARVLQRLKKIADQTPDAVLGETFRARNLGQFTDEATFRILKRSSAGEIAAQNGFFNRAKGAYGVGTSDQRAYQDFVTALEDAGNRIENVFVRGLAPLIPGFDKLSGSLVRSIETLAKAIPPEAMENIGKGIENFAKYLGTDEFQTSVRQFASGMAFIAGKIVSIVSALGGNVTGGSGAKGIHDRLNWSKHHRDGLKTVGELRRDRANGASALGQLGDVFMNSLRTKPGAGYVDPGLGALADKIQSSVPGINRFTAFNDDFHKGRNSAHNDDRAFDLTLSDPSQSAVVAEQIRKVLKDSGISGRVIDEYRNPSAGATAGHLHVQTDVRVMNAAGSNVIVSAKQVAPVQ